MATLLWRLFCRKDAIVKFGEWLKLLRTSGDKLTSDCYWVNLPWVSYQWGLTALYHG
jgi:hypothetical protein